MENEFENGVQDRSAAKKNISHIALLIVPIIIGIVFYSYYSTFLIQDDSPEAVTVIETTKEMEVAADYKNYIEAIWVDNDTEQARTILQDVVKKFEADDSYAQESISLGENEADLKLLLAKVTLSEDSEAGLSLYEQIYFDEKFTPTERANALFNAMQYVAEELPLDDSLFAAGKELVFGQDSFGRVLDMIEPSYEDITSPYALRLVALDAMRFAADMTGSYRIRGYMLSEEYRLRVSNEIAQMHEAITGSSTQIASQSELRAYLSENQAQTERLDTLLAATDRHNNKYMPTLVNNIEVFTTYNPEIIYGLNNLIWTYNDFEYLGYDVFATLSDTYSTGQAHLNRYANDDMELPFERDYELQTSILNLTMACGHALAEATLNEEEIAQYIAPTLALRDQNKQQLSQLTAIGEDESASCHNPIIYMGQQNQSFQDALVNTIGGWTSAQFTLTQ